MEKDYDLDKAINGYVVGQTVAQHTVVYFCTDPEKKIAADLEYAYSNVTRLLITTLFVIKKYFLHLRKRCYKK